MGLLGSAGAALEGAALGGAGKVTGGLLGAVSGLTHVPHHLKGATDGLTRGFKKGAESVKGGMVHVLGDLEHVDHVDVKKHAAPPAAAPAAAGNERPNRGHGREEPPRGADGAAPHEATRTAGGRGGGSGGGGGGAREAGAALHERGEKLETLKSRVDGLAAESEDFATMAHRLNMQARDGKC